MTQASTSDESNKIEITVECEHEIVKNYMINISICDIYQVWHCWTLDEVYTMDLRKQAVFDVSKTSNQFKIKTDILKNVYFCIDRLNESGSIIPEGRRRYTVRVHRE